MKKITLKDLEWQGTNNFTRGRSAKVTTIAIHWWDDPAKKPSINGVINWFKNPATQVSAHFVVSGDRVVQMVSLSNTAWHVANHNHHTVGIEVDPRMPGNTVETTVALIKFIRTYYPGIQYRGHNQFAGHASNRCPGTVLNAVKNFQAPKPTPTDDLYRVFKSGKQIGAYKVEKNAYNKFIEAGDKITHKGKDVTKIVKERQEKIMQQEINTLKAKLVKLEAENKSLRSEVSDHRKTTIELRGENDKLAQALKECKAELDLASDDTDNLNKLGSVLKWFLIRLGVK